VAATLAYSFVVTGLICLVLKKVLPGGLRVSEDDEEEGLDLAQHSEAAYSSELV
jgi:Amt family ammonium transporter